MTLPRLTEYMPPNTTEHGAPGGAEQISQKKNALGRSQRKGRDLSKKKKKNTGRS